MKQHTRNINIFRKMLTDVFRVMVNNLFKKSFYGKNMQLIF